MRKKLVKHGSSMALVIDKALRDILGIGPETEIDIVTDGRSLLLTPLKSGEEQQEWAERQYQMLRFSEDLQDISEEIGEPETPEELPLSNVFIYSFEDFVEDMRAFNPSFEENEPDLGGLAEYMMQKYSSAEEAVQNAATFILIVRYLIDNLEDFDTDDFAVYGSPEVGSLISIHLLRAVHYIFNSYREPQWEIFLEVDNVKRLAKKFEKDEKS